MKVLVTEAAYQSLEDLLDFLALSMPPSVVEAVGSELLAQADSLSRFPMRGQKEEWLHDRQKTYRRLVVAKNFKVISG